MGSQLALKSRIASTASLEKIFNAQEMIASSHIAKARDVALNAKPYTDAIFDAVQALVAHTHIDHPIVKKNEDNPRVAVLALTSDRGMAGPYTSSIIRETESLLARLDEQGKQPELYVYGRRGVTYYKYRNRDVAGTWGRRYRPARRGSRRVHLEGTVGRLYEAGGPRWSLRTLHCVHRIREYGGSEGACAAHATR